MWLHWVKEVTLCSFSKGQYRNSNVSWLIPFPKYQTVQNNSGSQRIEGANAIAREWINKAILTWLQSEEISLSGWKEKKKAVSIYYQCDAFNTEESKLLKLKYCQLFSTAINNLTQLTGNFKICITRVMIPNHQNTNRYFRHYAVLTEQTAQE